MNNYHTPGFYILEEERCKRKFEAIHKFARTNPEISNDCINLIFDHMNVLHNCPDAETSQVDITEAFAYKQLQQKKKTTFFQKIKEFMK